MLLKDVRRLVLFVCFVTVVLYIHFSLYGDPIGILTKWNDLRQLTPANSYGDNDLSQPQEQATLSTSGSDPSSIPGDVVVASSTSDDATDASAGRGSVSGNIDEFYNEIFSLSTKDRKFFLIDFKGMQATNPNIIPHPKLKDIWVVVAQQVQEMQSNRYIELVCHAVFRDGGLQCLHLPATLPIAATTGHQCKGDLSYFDLSIGPHDARVFLGPEKPYVVYGSNSMSTCFGQFIQDFCALMDWRFDMAGPINFRTGTELQRPPPWGRIEKNWFVFWDIAGQMYGHYDITPKRVFAQIGIDGSVGPDLAPLAAASDEKCLARYMPQLVPDFESIHQATNSLQITLCWRADPLCIPDENNTFLFTIYQHKTYYNYHSVYEPYVMVFHQRIPFQIHALSRRPIWIHGRQRYPDRATSDMFYVTSMSWKNQEQRYHGYLDDELFLAFGIEDGSAAGIDLQAGDLMGDLGLCSDIYK
ncbi:hypothetical protein BGZ61DRAFT_347260 [Ilyonectria robusta]|uniref:uncharacterized protein n=1 Tax=Ilyonectria robusta TaxID=1079257 RepID=UPI001E8E6B31|nr:uncharacterized protein BGZ61DRAFT_347260 [Ilyonectria robusta]KAH8721660.1 hypothetical protein BGZ61DRAFT_347260 [Ilyonectria robusta]